MSERLLVRDEQRERAREREREYILVRAHVPHLRVLLVSHMTPLIKPH